MATVKTTIQILTTGFCLTLTACVVPSQTVQQSRTVFTIEQNDLGQFVLCANDDCPEFQRKVLAQTQTIKPPNTPSQSLTQVYFALGSSKLPTTEITKLNRVLPQLRQAKQIHLRGWADSIGGKNTAINRRLAQQRAQTIRRWLIDQGINQANIKMAYSPACCNNKDTRTVVIDW